MASNPIPDTPDWTLVERNGRWYYSTPLPDLTDYRGPFFGGTADGLTMRGCRLLIDAGIDVWKPELELEASDGE